MRKYFINYGKCELEAKGKAKTIMFIAVTVKHLDSVFSWVFIENKRINS